MMPDYRLIENSREWQIQEDLKPFTVKLSPQWSKQTYLKEVRDWPFPVYLLGTNQWFNESVSSQTVYLPGADQHLFFAKAALEAVQRLGWIPDVIHCNDWHTGFVPVVMREANQKAWEDVASIFTIHNLAYQGEFGEDVLQKLDLPVSLFNLHQLETYGRVNFLKAGCVYSDQVNTVSPTYAKEIQTPEYGCRLEGLMQHLAHFGRLSGILNGIDYDFFNPETDPVLAAHFSSRKPEGKAACKTDLLNELKLPIKEGYALMGVVSRLSSQKGMDLMLAVSQDLFKNKVQLVVQGQGDPWLAERFRELQDTYPTQFRFIEKFDPAFAQKVYAGSDIFLMPSSFEPCGLGQMIAMRYGTLPLVRKTGGLADTVFEGQNGFVFEERSHEEFLAACKRAIAGYDKPRVWSRLVKQAMECDFSWSRSAKEYVSLYERALTDRRDAAAIAG